MWKWLRRKPRTEVKIEIQHPAPGERLWFVYHGDCADEGSIVLSASSIEDARRRGAQYIADGEPEAVIVELVTEEDIERFRETIAELSAPIPMILFCPKCSERHIDVGEFANKVHHTHACQGCGFVWRPAVRPTFGVMYLPGFKNEKTTGPQPSPKPPPGNMNG